MSIDIQAPPEQTAASLVSGILGDLQDLVEQQFQLTRRQIEAELRKCAAAAAVFGLGVAILLLAAIALCLTLSHLLHWMASPPGTDPGWLPLWACHAVVSAVFGISGGILTHVGRVKFSSATPLENPPTQRMQEQVL